ncbi:hypothetical protein LOK49_LG05G02878 [Camellia lanceoleosa]|uniref:Uncharacterized protein n=1 Tax=Camellia lanceoleosa TaxID=1840588 RepID=A0ACC0HPA0_9ERIC|nr:hypothetical protein LOK49_LG05G02878 [Camellia lanceoleosa]
MAAATTVVNLSSNPRNGFSSLFETLRCFLNCLCLGRAAEPEDTTAVPSSTSDPFAAPPSTLVCDLQWLGGLMKLESWWRLIVSFVAAGTAMVFLVKLGEALELRDSFWGVLLQGHAVRSLLARWIDEVGILVEVIIVGSVVAGQLGSNIEHDDYALPMEVANRNREVKC